MIHAQGGILNKLGSQDLRMLDHFQMGPNLVRGFAPNGIGPRDINPYGTMDAIGGTKYWGVSAELQMPFWFLPKEVGLKGAVYADAGGLYDYKGPTSWAATGEVNAPGCVRPTNNPPSPGTCLGLSYDDSKVVRTSVGVGLIWQSPFGPLRFDYAVPLTRVRMTACKNSGLAAVRLSNPAARPDCDGWNGAADLLQESSFVIAG